MHICLPTEGDKDKPDLISTITLFCPLVTSNLSHQCRNDSIIQPALTVLKVQVATLVPVSLTSTLWNVACTQFSVQEYWLRVKTDSLSLSRVMVRIYLKPETSCALSFSERKLLEEETVQVGSWKSDHIIDTSIHFHGGHHKMFHSIQQLPKGTTSTQ